jgi:hypothetical protein
LHEANAGKTSESPVNGIALPPVQFEELDQLGVPTAAPPVHVSVITVALAAAGSTAAATAATTARAAARRRNAPLRQGAMQVLRMSASSSKRTVPGLRRAEYLDPGAKDATPWVQLPVAFGGGGAGRPSRTALGAHPGLTYLTPGCLSPFSGVTVREWACSTGETVEAFLVAVFRGSIWLELA